MRVPERRSLPGARAGAVSSLSAQDNPSTCGAGARWRRVLDPRVRGASLGVLRWVMGSIQVFPALGFIFSGRFQLVRWGLLFAR